MWASDGRQSKQADCTINHKDLTTCKASETREIVANRAGGIESFMPFLVGFGCLTEDIVMEKEYERKEKLQLKIGTEAGLDECVCCGRGRRGRER